MKNRNVLIALVLGIVVLVVIGFFASWFDTASVDPTTETEAVTVEPEADTTGTTTSE